MKRFLKKHKDKLFVFIVLFLIVVLVGLIVFFENKDKENCSNIERSEVLLTNSVTGYVGTSYTTNGTTTSSYMTYSYNSSATSCYYRTYIVDNNDIYHALLSNYGEEQFFPTQLYLTIPFTTTISADENYINSFNVPFWYGKSLNGNENFTSYSASYPNYYPNYSGNLSYVSGVLQFEYTYSNSGYYYVGCIYQQNFTLQNENHTIYTYISNPEYWQFEENAINDYSNYVPISRYDNLNNQYEDLNNSYSTLESEYNTLNNSYTTLQTQYRELLNSSDFTISELFWSISAVPFGVLTSAFNVDVMGINLSAIITGLLTTLLLIWLIKRLL